MMSVTQVQPGWRAALALGFTHDGRRSIVSRRTHYGPLLIQKAFYPEGETCHVYLLHPPGGVVGGDQLQLDVQLDNHAHALLTTPAANKFYRSSGATALLKQSFTVTEHAVLEWLPQETILFAGSRAALQTRIDLAPGARFIGWEILSLGRPASRDHYESGDCTQHLALYRNAAPLIIETARLSGGARVLKEAWGWQGATVSGTLLASDADTTVLDAVRACIAAHANPRASATLINGVLVCRVLAPQAEAARAILADIWSVIRPILLQRPACVPRIWAT